jgi:uncharacterized membrane protein
MSRPILTLKRLRQTVSLFRLLLMLHVVGGSGALLSGAVPLLTRKGSRPHLLGGRTYACAMVLATVSAFILAAITFNVLLLVIAVFSCFLVYTGVRAIYIGRGSPVRAIDQAICMLTAAFSAWLLWIGFGSGTITCIFFGILGIILSLGLDWRLHSEDTDWLAVHLGAMCGAYIATVSAFLVVNITFVPQVVDFIGPTMIGAPLIAWASIRHRRKGVSA